MSLGSRDLLERVAACSQLRKSKRLRDLLLFLGEHSLRHPNCALHEQEVGVEVFGRRPDYDTSQDTLVRVQVSQLRKKLQDYFLAEGRDEPIILEIPKGSYVPVFRPRPDALKEDEPWHKPPATARPGHLMLAIGIAVVLVAIVLTWGISRARYQKNKPDSVVEAFWTQLFGNGQATYVVLSDVTLIEYEELLGRSIPLPEYETREFDRLADLNIADLTQRTLAKQFVHRVATSIPDVEVARDLSIVAARTGLQLNILSARNLSSSLVASQNTILLGSWRANPWVGLFEDRLSFKTEYHETPPSMLFVNRSPVADEPATFPAVWRRVGFCRVAYMSNPNRTGNVLLISGSDVISTAAGGRYVTSEESLRQLRRNLGLRAGDPMPHFQVLLRTRVVNDTIPSFEVVAWRPRGK